MKQGYEAALDSKKPIQTERKQDVEGNKPKVKKEEKQTKLHVLQYFQNKWGDNDLLFADDKKIPFTISKLAISSTPRKNRKQMEAIVDSAAIIAMSAHKHIVGAEHIIDLSKKMMFSH